MKLLYGMSINNDFVPFNLEFDVTLTSDSDVAINREDAAILACSINTSTGVSMNKSLLFTLTKNGKTLVTFWGASLVFNMSNSMNLRIYGLYVCTIEKSGKNASLLLQESGETIFMKPDSYYIFSFFNS